MEQENEEKKYKVVWKNKIRKQISKCPVKVQRKFFQLVRDIERKGAIQKEWSNFSVLGKDFYHCHLDYRWAAVWYWEKNTIVVEVTYVGSRENTPY